MANTVLTTASNVTLTGGGLIATATGAGAIAQSPDIRSAGKFAVEFTFDVRNVAGTAAGFARGGATNPTSGSGGATGGWAVVVYQSGTIYVNGSSNNFANVGALVDGDKILIAVDLDGMTFSVRKNGGTAQTGALLYRFISPAVALNASGQKITLNAGDTAFTTAPPVGFTAGWPVSSADAGKLIATELGLETWTQSETSALQLSEMGLEVWRASADAGDISLMMSNLGMQVWALSAHARRRYRPIIIESIPGEAIPPPDTPPESAATTTWEPATHHSELFLLNGNMDAKHIVGSGDDDFPGVRSTVGRQSGIRYVTFQQMNACGTWLAGVVPASANVHLGPGGIGQGAYAYLAVGDIRVEAGSEGVGALPFGDDINQVLEMVVNFEVAPRRIFFKRQSDSHWNGDPAANLVTGAGGYALTGTSATEVLYASASVDVEFEIEAHVRINGAATAPAGCVNWNAAVA